MSGYDAQTSIGFEYASTILACIHPQTHIHLFCQHRCVLPRFVEVIATDMVRDTDRMLKQ